MLHGQDITSDSVGLDPFAPGLKEWSAGQKDSAAHRNEVIQFVNNSRQRVNPPFQVGGNPQPSILSELRFVSVRLDYILCDALDGSETGIKVALRNLLKKTPFDGKTRDGFSYVYAGNSQRTSTSVEDGTTDEEIITPSYVPADAVDPKNPEDPSRYAGDVIEATYHPGSAFVIDGGKKTTPWLAPDDRQWAVVS